MPLSLARPHPLAMVAAVAMLALVASSGPGAAAGGPDAIVVNDGRAIPRVSATRTYSPSATGTAELGAAADALAEVKGGTDSPASSGALMALKGMAAPVGIESVIGPDNQVRVTPTTAFPARATALVTFSAGRCTGWLIGKDTMVTAGHCVHPGSGGAFYPLDSYRVFPGRNGASSPYGSCTARWTASVVGWTVHGRDDHDYGVIKLRCAIGNTTGWYGFFWTMASPTGLPTIITGYPGDKPLTQWRSSDLIRVAQPLRLFYQNDTVGGVSGSPVYYRRAGCGFCAMAVHAYGVYGSPPFRNNNHGTRITKTVFDNLMAWREAR